MLISAKNKEQKDSSVYFRKFLIEWNACVNFQLHTTCRLKVNLGSYIKKLVSNRVNTATLQGQIQYGANIPVGCQYLSPQGILSEMWQGDKSESASEWNLHYNNAWYYIALRELI